MSNTSISDFDKRVIVCSRLFNQKGEGAEWNTVAYLVDNLKVKSVGDYRILMNYNLNRGKGSVDPLEIDVILINRFGVFLIEVKDWWGKIVAQDGKWIQNANREHGDIFGEVNHKAKTLYAKLFGSQGDVKEIGNISVVGLIVLFKGLQFFENKSKSFENSKTVLGLTPELIKALTSMDFMHNRHKNQLLSDKDIEKITNALFISHDSNTQIVGNFQVEKELLPGDLFDAYEAVSMSIESRRVRIKRYKIPHFSINNQTIIENFERNARAVALLDSHPNILQTYDFFPHPSRADIFYEITELIKGERLDQIMSKCETTIPLKQQIRYLNSLCDALDHAHKNGVYHRNISPQTVHITGIGVVKLADFDFAKIVGKKTISVPTELLVENLLTAPELLVSSSKATPMSDIYSLGCLWYLLSALPNHPKAIEIDEVDKFDLPKSARDLMKKMLNRVSSNRPSDISEVQNVLNHITIN